MNALPNNSIGHPVHRLRLQAMGLALAGCVALAGVAALRMPLQDAKQYDAAIQLNDEQTEAINQSPFALILGEVRASMADLMWIKTERYLHRGVAFEPHIDVNELARTGEAVAVESATPAPVATPAKPAARGFKLQTSTQVQVGVETQDAPGHAREAPAAGHQEMTIVPVAAKDYRGFVGEIERRVQPWLDPGVPHTHTNGEELLPWYRLLTLSNPHHWRGYMIGAWWIAQQQTKDAAAMTQALDFIDEGIHNNPEIFQLRLLRGRLLLAQNRFADAIADFRAAQTLALKVRPSDGNTQGALWSSSDEEDFAAAVRYVPLLQWRDLHDANAARQQMSRALALLPDDTPLKDLNRQLNAAGVK